ncbi:hypothetical protein PR202_gb14997 [Eleusine coracana subsp. coracana]|uniref:Uncharacterized protein n=1 Tax=Eleusine coracana subsp. coracana TaxID=191504 RepID=A0AAV5EWH7_ELECO|nr:hypothetical protein PR202_gb14997 [Eleusine coracana subsp. coracana]
MNWIGRKIHLYNVTIGLYMLDWWERYLFSILPQCFSDSPLGFCVDLAPGRFSRVVFSSFYLLNLRNPVRVSSGVPEFRPLVLCKGGVLSYCSDFTF